ENPPSARPQRGPQAKSSQPHEAQTQPSKQGPQPASQPASQPAPQSSQPEQKVPTSTIPQASSTDGSASASSSTALQTEYVPHRRGSLMSSEVRRSGASTPSRMRRYDSHSLLSENSIASSRLDLAESIPYPEALLNHQGSFGQIQLTIRYVNLRKKLIVTVNGCKWVSRVKD
ncbi:hypothetical protein NFI96_006377, partial [Prochilodus magdalenae]